MAQGMLPEEMRASWKLAAGRWRTPNCWWNNPRVSSCLCILFFTEVSQLLSLWPGTSHHAMSWLCIISEWSSTGLAIRMPRFKPWLCISYFLSIFQISCKAGYFVNHCLVSWESSFLGRVEPSRCVSVIYMQVISNPRHGSEVQGGKTLPKNRVRSRLNPTASQACSAHDLQLVF